MNNAYICRNIQELKYLFNKFEGTYKKIKPSNYFSRLKFIKLLIFFDDVDGWSWSTKYNPTESSNYIEVNSLIREEKLNRILND